MHRIVASLLLICASSFIALQAASAVTMDWSPVGNSGNAADPADGDSGTPGIQNFGAVAYNYSIGTYDVTNSQYAEFLNTKDPTGANTLGLWNSQMANAFGGINFDAAGANGSKYELISGRQSHPVNAVTWYATVRFANWLNNGQGTGDTEAGAYTILHEGSPTPTPVPSNGNSITRNAGAVVFLPSVDEWYKAACYNPGTSSYFQYPTSSNATPTASGPTGLVNHANYDSVVVNLTDVGAYTGTTSPYGAFDTGGNVYQWNETLIGSSSRGIRGGSWNATSSHLLSSYGIAASPRAESNIVGFRVATVPEPSTGVLAVIACGLMWVRRRRFKWAISIPISK
jgi:formylglycine-generating enzyme